MGDVEDMIGELEEGESEDQDAEPDEEATRKQEEGEEETFGLDLDKAWSSSKRED